MKNLMVKISVTGVAVGSVVFLFQGNFQAALAGAGLLAIVGLADLIGRRGWLDF